MKIAFNTGARYTDHGQRIALWGVMISTHNMVACFYDFDRGISGHFPFVQSGNFNSDLDRARHAMHMYDWGQYDSWSSNYAVQESIQNVGRLGYDCFIQADCNVLARYSR